MIYEMKYSKEQISEQYCHIKNGEESVLPQCDLAAIYDNTEEFRRFAIYMNGKCMRISSSVPKWYQNVLKEQI